MKGNGKVVSIRFSNDELDKLNKVLNNNNDAMCKFYEEHNLKFEPMLLSQLINAITMLEVEKRLSK
jgi:hypothetical protein